MASTALEALQQGAGASQPECANCGARDGLMRCSRCRSCWFCSQACLKAYWPFHRRECRRNEFADLIEESEPKFASWMRSHGKMAVLKDDEVDRLERAGKAVSGPGRDEVMRGMYGRLDPKPAKPLYSPEELRAMERARKEERRIEAGEGRAGAGGATRGLPDSSASASSGSAGSPARGLPGSSSVSLGPRVSHPLASGLGIETPRYSWSQTQSRVELRVPLPAPVAARPRPSAAVAVALGPRRFSVVVDGDAVVRGTLWRESKVESSTWYVQDGVLEISLLKRHRRGALEDGRDARDAFWRALVREAPADETLEGEPPKAYFRTPWEDDADDPGRDDAAAQRRRRKEQSASRGGAAAAEGKRAGGGGGAATEGKRAGGGGGAATEGKRAGGGGGAATEGTGGGKGAIRAIEGTGGGKDAIRAIQAASS